MTTLDQFIDRIRGSSGLCYPDPNKLPDTDIALAVIDIGDRLITQLNLTREAWLEARKRVVVQANRSSYLLNADGFSKARFLFTVDDSDPNHRRREVEIVDREKLTNYFEGGTASVSAGTLTKHNARASAVYFDSDQGDYRIEFGPIPSQTADYDLFYEPATERPQSKDSVAFRFPQFSNYLADKAAIRLVKACEWPGMTAADCIKRRAEIRGDLATQVAEGDKLFWTWRQSIKNQTVGMKQGFGSDRW